MKFKVGDIVRFTGEKFKEFMYEKDHIVLAVGVTPNTVPTSKNYLPTKIDGMTLK